MTINGRRTMWRWLVAVGILLCLAPTAAGFYVMWQHILTPMITMGPEKFNQAVNQQDLQEHMQKDPVMLVSLFAVAPVGVALIMVSAKRLRGLRRPPALLPEDGPFSGRR